MASSQKKPVGSVLVVDDDEGIRRIVSFQLKRLGYKVDFAGNGNEAVCMAAQNKYSIIVMDINMPVMDGVEAISKIRNGEASEGKARAAIIAISSDHDLAKNALAAGADEFLSKPFDYKKMEEVISLWC